MKAWHLKNFIPVTHNRIDKTREGSLLTSQTPTIMLVPGWLSVADLDGANRADGDRPLSTRKQDQAGQRQDKGRVNGAGIRGGFQGVDRVLFRARLQGRDRVQDGDKVYSSY